MKYQNNALVKEVVYLYFFIRDLPCDIILEKVSKRKQRWIKVFLYKYILKMQGSNRLGKKKGQTYKGLKYILEVSKRVENGEKYYLRIKKNRERVAIRNIKNKDKVIIGFMANYSASWIGDELYNLFEQSETFEPYIFLLANYNGQSNEMIKQEYESHLQFFKEKNFRVVETYNVKTGKSKKQKKNGINPDICIWLTSWLNLFKKQYRLEQYPVDTLHAYIPYGIMTADNLNHNFVYHQYNHRIHNMVWKNFEESVISVNMAKKYSFIRGDNAVFTGYPKMDMFYLAVEEDTVWQPLIEKSGNSNPKRIIYAPHHTVNKEDAVYFSTFAYNYKAMLELAKKYENDTVWIFKPHPHLKFKAIKYGIFDSEEEWENYENEWRKMKNADVIKDGTYYNLFMHSDGMILDSVSFLAEYLYVHKPLLFLRGKGQQFNDFGKELMKIHYSVDGNDIFAIEEFILDVILKQNDRNKNIREQFFRNNLDYRSVLGKDAGENIFNDISYSIGKFI